MPNGESIRDSLIWSDNCKALFCFSCCLFSLNELQTLRDSWGSTLDESKIVASSLGLNDHFKKKISRTRRQVDNDTNCNSECISDEERAFKIKEYYAALDTLLMKLSDKYQAVQAITQLFEFIVKPPSNPSAVTIKAQAKCLVDQMI